MPTPFLTRGAAAQTALSTAKTAPKRTGATRRPARRKYPRRNAQNGALFVDADGFIA